MVGPGVAAAPAVPYEVSISGIEDDSLRNLLEEFSRLVTLKDNPPATLAGLRRRAGEDVERLANVLDSRAFFGADIGYTIDADAEPAEVEVTVAPGEAYELESYRVTDVGPHTLAEPIRVPLANLGLTIGMAAESASIAGARQRLLDRLAENGRPLASIVDQSVVVDHATQSVSVTVEIDAGPRARFGETEFVGLDSVDRPFVAGRLVWEKGAVYAESLVAATRQSLVDTGLFRSVRIEHAESVGEDGLLPMTITVAEREHRTVGAGASYSTTIGPGAKVFWQHRNIFGEGERLRLSLGGTTTRYGFAATGSKPDFLVRDQSLVFDLRVEEEDTDAFDSQRIEGSAGLQRQIGRHYSVSAGLTLERTFIEENGDESDFTLIGLPLSLRRDTTDAVLDPTRGNRLNLTATPYPSFLGSDVGFVVAKLSDSQYIPFLHEDLTLAGWGRVGAIFGADNEDVPASKRLFAGGGGSIRAFDFQQVGPLDEDEDPIGGRLSLEIGTELRYRVTDTIGVVAFVEGGNVFTDLDPELGQEGLLWGAGFGARYFTAIGPLRVDFAFPIDRRDVDDAFQFYIGLGQAF